MDDILSDDHSVISDRTIDNIEAAGAERNEKYKRSGRRKQA